MVQTAIVHAVRKQGGFAFKMAHRFQVGVVDLLIQLPDLPTVLVEVKTPGRPLAKPVPVALTPLQRNFIRDYQKAGGYAGWMVVAPRPSEHGLGYLLYAGSDPNATYIDLSGTMFVSNFELKTLHYTVLKAVEYMVEHHYGRPS